MNTNPEDIDYIASQLNKNNKKKILFIVPESAGDIFLSTSLLPSMHKNYSGYEIYFACKEEYQDILFGNPYITKVLNYKPIMENQIVMEGTASWKGLFNISIMTTILTQRMINYLNNGETKIMFELKEDCV